MRYWAGNLLFQIPQIFALVWAPLDVKLPSGLLDGLVLYLPAFPHKASVPINSGFCTVWQLPSSYVANTFGYRLETTWIGLKIEEF